MRLVDKKCGGTGRHPFLHRRLGAARDLHRGDDDIGAVEDFIDFGFARRNVREPHDQRKGCGLIETFLLFKDAEGLELARDLLA